ncbi:MAG: hypothetical protein KA152_12215 [Verrucomicrobiales bacterium]|nr:hypothetical protein [Verrucomicrobiales bacterium]HQW30063.1 hypothetical protein [Verrucomicrobiales bacterium]
MKIQLTLVVSFLLALHSVANADPAVKADFSTATLPETWAGMKGEWKVVDGALVGAELESDEHAAVFSIPDPHKDSTISFRFRLDGAKGFNLSYNHPKGHLFRVTLVGDVLTLAMDKDKKDPASKAEVLGKETLTLKPGEWTEMSCSLTGDTAKVTCGGKTISGTHANLAKEKTGYRLVVQGASVGFDDVAFTSTK